MDNTININRENKYRECKNRFSKKYYYENREQILEKARLYRIRNHDIILQKKREYNKNNREKVNEQTRQCYIRNKHLRYPHRLETRPQRLSYMKYYRGLKDVCICGSTYSRSQRCVHAKTKKHQFMLQFMDHCKQYDPLLFEAIQIHKRLKESKST